MIGKILIIVAIGIASQYGNGVSERVIHVRQTKRVHAPLPLELPVTNGYIAVKDCEHIGEVWYLRPIGGNKVESFLVIDCAGSTETIAWMNRNNILVEVDYNTAKRWNTVGRGIKIERIRYLERGVME